MFMISKTTKLNAQYLLLFSTCCIVMLNNSAFNSIGRIRLHLYIHLNAKDPLKNGNSTAADMTKNVTNNTPVFRAIDFLPMLSTSSRNLGISAQTALHARCLYTHCLNYVMHGAPFRVNIRIRFQTSLQHCFPFESGHSRSARNAVLFRGGHVFHHRRQQTPVCKRKSKNKKPVWRNPSGPCRFFSCVFSLAP